MLYEKKNRLAAVLRFLKFKNGLGQFLYVLDDADYCLYYSANKEYNLRTNFV